MNKKVNVAVVGCGVVGSGVVRLVVSDSKLIAERTGIEVRLKYVVDKNTKATQSLAGELGLPSDMLRDSLDNVLTDTEVETVIELVGGTDAAYNIVEDCLRARKNVVTANKALLAERGTSLFALARERGVSLAFEASCAGCIPIIRALSDGMSANRFEAIFGVVNGTCNYILSKMSESAAENRRLEFADALAQAQEAGFAEADPTLDLNGSDSGHKITLMAGIAFGVRISYEDIPITGIEQVSFSQVQQAQAAGYCIKLVASAVRREAGLELAVSPRLLSAEHPLSQVHGVFNAVSLYASNSGHTLYYGRGAGGRATASAIVADCISIANGSYPALFKSLRTLPDQQVPQENVRQRGKHFAHSADGTSLPFPVLEVYKENTAGR